MTFLNLIRIIFAFKFLMAMASERNMELLEARKRLNRLVFWKNFILVSSVIVLASLVIAQGGQRIGYYVSNPTYISTQVVKQQEATFPTFSMCPESSKAYKKDVIEKHGYDSFAKYNCRSIANLRKGICPYWTSNTSDISTDEYFDQVTFKATEMIKSIEVQTVEPDENGKIVQDITDISENVITNYHRAFGRCYTMSLQKKTLMLGVRSLRLEFNVYGKVYFHPPGQFLALNGRMGYKILEGDSIEAMLTYQEFRMLRKHNPDFEPEAVDQNKFRTTCNPGEYDACIYSSLKRLMLDEVNCTAPYMAGSEGLICEDHTKARVAFKIHWDRVTNQLHDCQVPCNFILNDLAKSGNYMASKSKDNSTVLKVHFPNHVSLSKEDYIYPFLSLIADCGAYFTTLLGFSVLDLASSLINIAASKTTSAEAVTKTRVTPMKY